jgi:hypothetical protein
MVVVQEGKASTLPNHPGGLSSPIGPSIENDLFHGKQALNSATVSI